MIRNRKLADRIIESPFTYEEMAEKAGISRDTLIKRLDRGNWRAGEITAISKALDLPLGDVIRYFLPELYEV